jgi:putative transposase
MASYGVSDSSVMKVFRPQGMETFSMSAKRRKRHAPEQIVRKLRDADAMLNAGKGEAAVLQSLEVSQTTFDCWRNQYGGMKSTEAKRPKEIEDENQRLKEIVADSTLDNRMLKHVAEGNW